MGWRMREDERHLITGCHRELTDCSQIFAQMPDGRFEKQRLRPGYRLVNVVADTADPWDGQTVVKPHDKVACELHSAAYSDGHPDNPRRAALQRHEVDQAHDTFVRLESRLQDEGIVAISS